jgi:hypothetical protein
MKQSTEKRVKHILEQMRSAMPEIKRQVMIYEKNMKADKLNKSPKVAPQFRNA